MGSTAVHALIWCMRATYCRVVQLVVFLTLFLIVGRCVQASEQEEPLRITIERERRWSGTGPFTNTFTVTISNPERTVSGYGGGAGPGGDLVFIPTSSLKDCLHLYGVEVGFLRTAKAQSTIDWGDAEEKLSMVTGLVNVGQLLTTVAGVPTKIEPLALSTKLLEVGLPIDPGRLAIALGGELDLTSMRLSERFATIVFDELFDIAHAADSSLQNGVLLFPGQRYVITIECEDISDDGYYIDVLVNYRYVRGIRRSAGSYISDIQSMLQSSTLKTREGQAWAVETTLRDKETLRQIEKSFSDTGGQDERRPPSQPASKGMTVFVSDADAARGRQMIDGAEVVVYDYPLSETTGLDFRPEEVEGRFARLAASSTNAYGTCSFNSLPYRRSILRASREGYRTAVLVVDAADLIPLVEMRREDTLADGDGGLVPAPAGPVPLGDEARADWDVWCREPGRKNPLTTVEVDFKYSISAARFQSAEIWLASVPRGSAPVKTSDWLTTNGRAIWTGRPQEGINSVKAELEEGLYMWGVRLDHENGRKSWIESRPWLFRVFPATKLRAKILADCEEVKKELNTSYYAIQYTGRAAQAATGRERFNVKVQWDYAIPNGFILDSEPDDVTKQVTRAKIKVVWLRSALFNTGHQEHPRLKELVSSPAERWPPPLATCEFTLTRDMRRVEGDGSWDYCGDSAPITARGLYLFGK